MKELTTLQKKQIVNWFKMVKFINHTNQESNEFLKEYGLTLAQFDALNQIYRHQPLTQQELAEELMISRGGISQMLKRLEGNGWIKRDQEWKVKYINLTTLGHDLVMTVQHVQAVNQAKMLDGLNEQENEKLSELLNKLMNT